MKKMYSIILCGGSGSRLWPLSRKNYPKQFLNLYSDKSLLQETYLRMRKIMSVSNIFLVTNKENYFNVLNQVKEVEENFEEKNVLTEPESLNTAPAMAYAMKHLLEKEEIGFDSPVIFLPSDHYIGKEDVYLGLVEKAMAEVSNKIGTIGITPTGPKTSYGYIKKGDDQGDYFQVLEFKEKPDKITAGNYFASGEYVWNAGMYLFNGRTFVRELNKHAKNIYEMFVQSFDYFIDNFKDLPSVPFDVAVSEKSDNIIVFEGDFEWNDIGSFDSLAEILGKDSNKKHIGIDSKNIFVHSPNDLVVATLGVDDLVIVENNDSILIYKKGRSEDVKKIVDYMKDKKFKEIEHNLIVHRPWGKYEVLIENPAHKVKKITVYPGAKLSLQSHLHRAEHWIVVKGLAKATNGEKIEMLQENESTFIPALTKHRLENPGKVNLELIEVQTGEYMEEDDIVRYEDKYKRV